MYTYESFDKNEVENAFNEIRPRIFQLFEDVDPISFKKKYVLKYWK